MKKLKISDSKFESRDGYERSVLLTSEDFGADTKMQMIRIAPGKSIKPHHHNVRTECFRMVSGNGTIKVNGNVEASSEDDIILCQPGDVHEFINTSTTEQFTILVIRTNDPGDKDMILE